MNLEDFNFEPVPPIEGGAKLRALSDPLGPLNDLPGFWSGTGFNMIWRPYFDPTGAQNHFLELNLTDETFQFAPIGGTIPNRGLLQADIEMVGLTYLQQVNDHNLSTPSAPVGLHAEPGVWLTVPATTDPAEPPTVVRMGSIPHGTAIVAQGIVTLLDHAPDIGPVSSPGYPAPIDIATGQPVPQNESNLAFETPYRSSGQQVAGITQTMIDHPESVLTDLLGQQKVLANVTLAVFTNNASAPTPPPPLSAGGGTANTAFLIGAKDGPNADATEVQSTFWIELIEGENGAPNFLQLQYRQLVYLEFAGERWPHVSVATLVKQPDPKAQPAHAPRPEPQPA